MFVAPVDGSVVWWHRGIVERVVDGDNVYIEWDKGFNRFERGVNLRLAYIDAYDKEKYVDDEGKNRIRTTVKREAAKLYLEYLLPVGREILWYSHKDAEGKYNRKLSEVQNRRTLDGINCNRALLDAGHAILWKDKK